MKIDPDMLKLFLGKSAILKGVAIPDENKSANGAVVKLIDGDKVMQAVNLMLERFQKG